MPPLERHDSLEDDSGGFSPVSEMPPYKFNCKILDKLGEPEILILDDAGWMFRTQLQRRCWPLPPSRRKQKPWIVLKMSSSVCRGDLWCKLTRSFAG